MDHVQLVSELDQIAKRLASRPDLFELDLVREAPVEADALDEVERRIGARLPEPLRSFHLLECSHFALRWRLRPEGWRDAGFDDDVVRWGQIAIRDARRLGVSEWFDGLVQITDAGSGNGWFLDLTAPGDRIPVVWGDHDAAERLGAVLDDVDALFAAMIDHLVVWRSELGERIAPLLRTGTLPHPDRRARR